MLIKVRNRYILATFGWKTFPSCVTAAPKLWLHWLTRGIIRNWIY